MDVTFLITRSKLSFADNSLLIMIFVAPLGMSWANNTVGKINKQRKI
jgi:hypothetical protein